MLILQLFQHLGIGGIAGLGLFHRGQAQLIKEQLTQLLGRIDIEGFAGAAEDQALTIGDALREHGAKLLQLLPVNGHAGFLHAIQHRAKGQLNIKFGGSNDAKYNELTELYQIYRQIGGYPEIIKRYRETGNISRCYDEIENILETFEKESGNYFQNSKEPLIFKTVYTEAIKCMCHEKQGSGSKLVETVTTLAKQSQKMLVSRDEVTNAISWLTYSGIIGECGMYNNGDVSQYIPARRLYYMDCGIAAYLGRQAEIPERDITGLLTETFVFRELNRLYGKNLFGSVPVEWVVMLSISCREAWITWRS